MIKYFKFRELVRSNTADKLKIDNMPNDPEIIDNIIYVMCRLDEIRENYGRAIYVNSGYRCKKLNDKVYGVKDSKHQSGLAVDLRYDSELLEFIKKHCSFDKLLIESNKTSQWLHVQFLRDISKERRAIGYIDA